MKGCPLQPNGGKKDISSLDTKECFKKCSEMVDCYAAKWGGDCNFWKLNEKDKCTVDISSQKDWVFIKTNKCMSLNVEIVTILWNFFKGIKGKVSITGAENILNDDENVWKPVLASAVVPALGSLSASVPSTSERKKRQSEETIELEIDLGHFYLINEVKVKNGNPGIVGFELKFSNLLQNVNDLIEYTQLNDGQEFVKEVRLKPMQKFILRLTVTQDSELKFLGFKTIDDYPSLLQHQTTSFFVSGGPKDELIFLHPYNCRTRNHILWSCHQGQLRNRNGKFLKFMTKAVYDAMEEKQGVISSGGDNLIDLVPTLREDGGDMSSMEINFSSENVEIKVNGLIYFLKPMEFPEYSFLKRIDSVDGDQNFKISKLKPGFGFTW